MPTPNDWAKPRGSNGISVWLLGNCLCMTKDDQQKARGKRDYLAPALSQRKPGRESCFRKVGGGKQNWTNNPRTDPFAG